VQALKEAGMKMLIVTAKHHDGFCLWPSKYTEHSVKNSPWKNGKGDVIREVADACHEAGIKLGIYLSPWDRHEPTYGDSPAYNRHFMNQLTELLTQYDEIADVWFDGACGEGPNGKRQVYDWAAYWQLIRKLQPKATITICGPDARWCGNEAGISRQSEWSVIPVAGYDPHQPQFSDQNVKALLSIPATEEDLGSREKIKDAPYIMWYPAQVDTSIRPGWFYHASEDDKVKSLAHLLDVYYGSVGGNAQLLLNIPPDRRGRFHENDVQRLKGLGEVLRATFAIDLARGAKAKASATRAGDRKHSAAMTVDGDKGTYWTTDDDVTSATIEYDLGEIKVFNVAMLQEQITVGQRVEEFGLDIWDGREWKEIAHSTTIGYKRLLRFPDVTAAKVRLRIVQSRANPTISTFGLFCALVPGSVG